MKPILAALLLFFSSAALARYRDYIEESRVVYPKQTAHFVLKEAKFDRKHLGDGVELSYAHEEHAGLMVDVLVRPAGNMRPSEGLESGFARLRAELESARQLGELGDLQVGAERDIDLALDGGVRRGRAVGFHFTVDSVRSQSRVVLFYRHNYWIELHTNADAFETAALDAIVAEAVTELVAGTRVRSRGGCQPVSDDGCVESFRDPSAKSRKGEAYTTIKYPRGAWARRRLDLPEAAPRLSLAAKPGTPARRSASALPIGNASCYLPAL